MFKFSPSLKHFFSYAKPYRWWITGATIFGLLKFNIPVVFPWIFKDVIDELVTKSSPDINKINYSLAALFVLYIIWGIITFYRSYLGDQAGQRMIFDLRHDLWVHLQKMWLDYYEKRQIGSIASRLISDTAIAQNFVGAAITNTIMDLSSLVVISVLIFSMNWHLALVSVAVLPAYVFFTNFYRKRILHTSRMAQQKMEKIAGIVHERLSGISVIKSYTREKEEERNFLRKSRTHLMYRIANIKNSAMASATIGFITSTAPILVVWYGAFQVMRANLTVGELTAFYVYLGMFYGPLNRLSELNIRIANSISAIERIHEVLQIDPEVHDRPDARYITKMRGEIRFLNVSFAYELPETVLNEINLHIPAGSTFALVGPSGSGKTTFIKLLPRFYDVTDGSITIDEIDVRDFQMRALRRDIAVVPQAPILFSGTIYENILMGNPTASPEEVRAAAISANAHDFIMEFKEGYQTETGEGGVALSGGQRQRISLARAFLKNAPILILDEATSALDSRAENLIQDALKRLMENRTTIIIAHRLSTVQMADQIVVFNKGRIVETGNHRELLEKSDGLYRKLYEAQFKDFMLTD